MLYLQAPPGSPGRHEEEGKEAGIDRDVVDNDGGGGGVGGRGSSDDSGSGSGGGGGGGHILGH